MLNMKLEQKKNKNYLRGKINYNTYIGVLWWNIDATTWVYIAANETQIRFILIHYIFNKMLLFMKSNLCYAGLYNFK